MNATTITAVNIYRDGAVWCYAAWAAGEYDHSDTLDCDSESDACESVAEQFPGAAIRRVADVSTGS